MRLTDPVQVVQRNRGRLEIVDPADLLAAGVLNDTIQSVIDFYLEYKDLLAIFEAERLAVERATGAPYQATIEDLRSFLERSVYNDASTVEIQGATFSALWSYEIGGAEAQFLSLALAEQSGGQIRVIGNTAVANQSGDERGG